MRQTPRKPIVRIRGKETRTTAITSIKTTAEVFTGLCDEPIQVFESDGITLFAEANCGDDPIICPVTGCVPDIIAYGFYNFDGGPADYTTKNVTVSFDNNGVQGAWLAYAGYEFTQWCPDCVVTVTPVWTATGPGNPPNYIVNDKGGIVFGVPSNNSSPAPGMVVVTANVTCGVFTLNQVITYTVMNASYGP